MELAAALLALCGAALFSLLAAGMGQLLLRVLRPKFTGPFIEPLSSIALGIAVLEVLLFWAQATPRPRTCIVAILILATVVTAVHLRRLNTIFRDGIKSAWPHSLGERLAASAVLATLLLEGLCAVAAISSSDAIVYFTVQAEILRSGFHPSFAIHAFLSGQNHLLIFLGLALGSEKLALALEFLGGALAAATLWSLARRWMPAVWAWLTVLLFLLTPVVVWQISGAGGPDLWLAFGTILAVIVISDAREQPTTSHAVLAGALTGWVAGGKYTACAVAFALLMVFVWETRSFQRFAAFVGSALAAGVWPYARNFHWANDPFFPLLSRWIDPSRANYLILASVSADIGADKPWRFIDVLRSLLFVRVNSEYTGIWEFLGPLVLVFSPLLFRVVRNTPLWRVTLTVWLVSAALIARSGLGRYELQILPLALAACLSGVASLRSDTWLRRLAYATLAGSLLVWTGGLVLYQRHALMESVGAVSRDAYLRQTSQSYPEVEFINSTLSEKTNQGSALVFFVEDYYLRVPFLYANPGESWPIDFDWFKGEKSLEKFLESHDVAWIVRAPDYPAPIAAAFATLENTGRIVPIATRKVSDGNGRTTEVTILKVTL